MRVISLSTVVIVALVSAGHAAALPPNKADEAASMQVEALGDRSPQRWQGRQHYLYDAEYQPNSETVGSVSV